MPRNIDLLLDQLMVDQEYRHSHGNTEPSILNGLFGNVVFVPWKGFRKIIDDSVAVVETFREDDLEEVNTSLHQARKFIARSKKDHIKSLEIEKERKARYCGSDVGDSSNSVHHPPREEEGSTDVAFTEHRPQAKRIKPNPNHEAEKDLGSPNKFPKSKNAKQKPWYERKSVTNSTSISTLHHHVMDALRDFLDLMYPSYFLRLEQISLSCGNLMQYASDSMLAKFMEEHVLSTSAPHERKTNLAMQARVEVEENATASPRPRQGGGDDQGQTLHVSGGSQTALEEAQTFSHQTAGVDHESSTTPLEVANMSSEIENTLDITVQAQNADNLAPRHSKRLQEKSNRSLSLRPQDAAAGDDSISIPLRPVIPLNQTPDQCLFHNSVEKSSKIPVCCFEFKGPTLDLSGLISPNNSATNSSPSNEIEPASSDASNDVRTATATTSNVPISCSEVPPQDPIDTRARDVSRGDVEGDDATVDNEDDIYIPGASAKDVAEHYERLFSNNLSDNAADQKSSSRLVVLPIAQVICQAILSKTGCVFLTNHQMSLALRVVEDEEAIGFRAKVFVTGAIPSNKEPGQVAALLGFTRFCLKMEADSDDEALLDPMRRLIMGFSYLAYNSDIDEDTLDPDWCPGDSGSDSQGSSYSGGRTRSFHRDMRQIDALEPAEEDILSSASVERTPSRRTFNSTFTEETNGDIVLNDDDTRTDISSGSDSSLSTRGAGKHLVGDSDARSVMSCRKGRKDFRSRTDEKLKNMFASSKGTVAVGASGVVIRTVWEGVQVAAKTWNGHKREGFLNLRREIRIYKRIESKCRCILGSAVPRFLFGWDRPDMHSVYRKELILITEFVGSEVVRGENNRMLLLSDDSVTPANETDQRRICVAALRSLRSLHQNGFLHGDVALRNMRVARQESELGWNVWWLGLGKTLEVSSTAALSYFSMEVRQCLALFGQLV